MSRLHKFQPHTFHPKTSRRVLSALMALAPLGVFAATEQVIVSATRSEQTAVYIPANILVIGAEEIERNGAKTLTELLRSRAGIQVQDVVGSGARGTTLVMRGFGSNGANNTLVLLDGQKLNNPSLAAPDLSSIAMADIERVEIIQGSAGVLFGDQATGGVINIITKRPQERSANVEVGFGSEDWESYRGNIGEAFDNGLAYRVAAEKHLTDNYRDNNEADYDNVLARGSYTQTLFSAFVEAQQINDNMRLPGSISPTLIAQDRRQTRRPNDFTNIDTDRYRVGGEVVINPQWKIAAEYSYRDADSTGVFFGTQFTDATTVKAFTPRVLGTIDVPYGPLIATLGYDNQGSEYES
ncbi:MAG: TonB-dependent receptor plug domain-containing protein, partial [Spongiibacteraceae bacterium]